MLHRSISIDIWHCRMPCSIPQSDSDDHMQHDAFIQFHFLTMFFGNDCKSSR